MKALTIIITLLAVSSSAAQLRPPDNASTPIPVAGSNDRTQLPVLIAHACTLQARASNGGSIYIGGSTVTNASGGNPGIKLNPGDSYSNILVKNRNWIHVAADNANDVVDHICN